MTKPIRKTKILATIGPASNSKDMLKALVETGVNVFRMNFSHGTHADHQKVHGHIRDLEKDIAKPIGILADLQGPKHRVGQFKEGHVAIKAGQIFTFDSDEILGDETRVYLPHPEVIKAVQIGEVILLDDGRVRVQVVDKTTGSLVTKVIAGTSLSDRKGFNLPQTELAVSALTEKDLRDLDFAMKLGVDFVALSFVQTADDVAQAKKIINGRAAVVAKIEKPQAVKNIDEIIEISDGIMIARGDLGVEMPAEEVPAIQKRIIRKARHAVKPVIVATQMLESMTSAPTPTRAEASDVAAAVYEGTDAVMLSAETAAGDYPIQAVTMMAKIALSVEQDDTYHRVRDAEINESDHTVADAITVGAKNIAEEIDAKLIVTFTSSGSTALRASRLRSRLPILALTPEIATSRRLCLSFGVFPMITKEVNSFMRIVEQATAKSLEKGVTEKGDTIVITAGVPFGVAGSTNSIRIAWV